MSLLDFFQLTIALPPPCTLHIVHKLLYIIAHCTSWCTLYIVHCLLPTLHSAQAVAHGTIAQCTLYDCPTPHLAQYTLHFVHVIAHNCTLHKLLYIVRCTLYIVRLLSPPPCTLHIVHVIAHNCTLHKLLHIVRCTLYIVRLPSPQKCTINK